jgi:hypothetical protein
VQLQQRPQGQREASHVVQNGQISKARTSLCSSFRPPLESPFRGKVREAELKRSNGSRQPDEPQRLWAFGPCWFLHEGLVDSSSLTPVRELRCCRRIPICGLVHAHFFGLLGGLDARGLRPNGGLVHGDANAVLTALDCTAKTH